MMPQPARWGTNLPRHQGYPDGLPSTSPLLQSANILCPQVCTCASPVLPRKNRVWKEHPRSFCGFLYWLAVVAQSPATLTEHTASGCESLWVSSVSVSCASLDGYNLGLQGKAPMVSAFGIFPVSIPIPSQLSSSPPPQVHPPPDWRASRLTLMITLSISAAEAG